MVDHSVPFRFAHHDCLAELGRGSTGIVYRAQDSQRHRQVALKTLLKVSDAIARTRFLREAQVLGAFSGETETNIPALHQVGVINDQPFYTRDLVEGDTLERRVTSGAMDLPAGIKILRTVAEVVQRVHAKGVAHRNLHPENVLIASGGKPMLIGFGRVGLLKGAGPLAAGSGGTPAEVDVQALVAMLGWLCAELHQPIPAGLQFLQQPESVPSVAALADALGS